LALAGAALEFITRHPLAAVVAAAGVGFVSWFFTQGSRTA
jgi:hypothetical protein